MGVEGWVIACSGDGGFRVRKLFHGIERYAILAEAVVEMGPRGVAGGAYGTDGLPGFHLLAYLDTLCT